MCSLKIFCFPTESKTRKTRSALWWGSTEGTRRMSAWERVESEAGKDRFFQDQALHPSTNPSVVSVSLLQHIKLSFHRWVSLATGKDSAPETSVLPHAYWDCLNLFQIWTSPELLPKHRYLSLEEVQVGVAASSDQPKSPIVVLKVTVGR